MTFDPNQPLCAGDSYSLQKDFSELGEYTVVESDSLGGIWSELISIQLWKTIVGVYYAS